MVVGDGTGRVYVMQLVFPTPLDLDEESEITQKRLSSPSSKGAGLH